MTWEEMSKKELINYASEHGIDVQGKQTKADLITAIKNQEVEEMEEMENVTVEGTEKVDTKDTKYVLDDGTEGSRSALIRQEFKKGLSRQDIAKNLGVKYYTVYAATANMFNAAHPEGGLGAGRSSVLVAKVNTKFEYLDADGNVVDTAEEAVQVPRADLMRELVEAGALRGDVKKFFDVAYATVYAATKTVSDGAGKREHKTVTDPETGEVIARNEYIRKLFAEGMERREIAKKLTAMTGDLVDYSTVWAATKPAKKEAEAEVEGEAPVEDAE